MVYVLLIIISALFVSNLDISLYPSVDRPVISVSVNADDAGPEQVELQIAEVLEDAVGSLENLNTITSISSTGQARLILEFDYGTDLDEASDSLDTILNSVDDNLPDWADTPETRRQDVSSSSTIMKLVITGSSDEYVLKTIAEDTVSPLLERIEGVSTVDVHGTGDKQYNVNIDPIRLAAYDLTLDDVESALEDRNVQGTIGTITQGDTDYSISFDERYVTVSEIENTVIDTIDDVPVMVKDLGSVEIETETDYQERYLDGSPVVTLSITNESDSNEATVAKDVTEQLDSISAQLPSGIGLTIQQDSTTMITSTLSEVYKNALEGVLLAALIIFLFLRNLKATLIISLSMPISILFTLMTMSWFDITVNSMSMSGLILGIGMIVDASIIILENTYNYRQKGHGSAASAILGSENMSVAIVASTLTTLCVFIPLIIFKNDLEMIGLMFQDLIVTVCIAMVASLFVALTLVPALSGSILRIDTRVQKPLRFRLARWIDSLYLRFEAAAERVYAKILDYFLGHRLLLVVLLVLLLLFSLQHFSGIGLDLTPPMNTDDHITLSLTLPAGTTKAVTRSELFGIQSEIIDTLPEGSYTRIITSVGETNTGNLELTLPDITDQEYGADELKDMIRPLLYDNPSATWTFGATRGPGSGSPIDISVSGDDTDAIAETANSIAAIIDSFVPQATNVSTDLEDGSPKINVEVDQEMAGDLGISMDTLYDTVEYALSGTTATTISTFSSDTTYDLVVQMDPDSLQTINDLGNLLIEGDDGNVRLDSLATFAMSNGPSSITREDKQRLNHVTASLSDGYDTNTVQTLVEEALDEHLLIPEGITVSQSGDIQQFATYTPTLIVIFILALLLVFAVMAAQFESLVDPFIIFATIPLLLIGVVFIHLTMNQSFSLFSIVGIVALIGVVVNNGIVLVDSINQRVATHMPVRQACLEAARTRLRPIMMTTLTTVLGMIPLAFFPGEGAEMMQPIAVTFIGGLLTGSFLTLFLSPVLYSVLNKRREKHYFDPDSLANQLALFDKEHR
jgi:multidrug efflux pump subunit AcrB